MTNDYSYQLRYLFAGDQEEDIPTGLLTAAPGSTKKITIPEEFNGRDYLAFLLSIDAELEHALMLQYLYAAYSLGGAQVPQEHQNKVREWQETVLGIAKEEMGHFVSVQNVLRLIGAPLHFERLDFPWDTPFNPFPFKLEPLNRESLAKYIYTESPAGWIDTPLTNAKEDEIRQEIQGIINDISKEEQVGEPISLLFKAILNLIQDKALIPDTIFQADSYPFQGKFSEWGRGYTGGQRGTAHSSVTTIPPDVLVAPLASRTDAIQSLNNIAHQGEATDLPDAKTAGAGMLPSHFERFLAIYTEMREIIWQPEADWSPVRNVAVNPYIPTPGLNTDEADTLTADQQKDEITHPVTTQWFHLLNVRYRMLLAFIHHSFVLDEGFSGSKASPRGTMINASFGEMYNVRGISNVLVKSPIAAGSETMAGPGFLIPYTVDLPVNEYNRWLVHRDLLQAAGTIINRLLAIETSDVNREYLYSLRESDNNLLTVIAQIID